MVVLKPNVVRGGRAIGLGNNLYLMKGRTHSKGGIDIGKNPKTGLEVENNEVMQVSPQGVRVFSAQPILGGISPAQYILGGANPNQVFNAQEQWKKINRVNDDGTRKAKYGKEEIVAKRYNSAYNALIKNGYTDKDAERLVPFIISQSILESGYVNKDDNNYGGYLKNGKRIKYDSEEEFYSSHINNLKNKWPTIFNAKNIDDYLRIIHGGDIKEGNVWDYAPKEENDNYDNRVKSVYNKINNYIDIYRKNYKNRDFITKLDPIEEQEFQKWYKSQAVVNGISLNPDDKEHYYDYRGFWKENRGKSNIGHFTDKYKIPGHPTFSEESVYSQPIVKGGKWNYINTPVKEEKFVPSNFNLNYKYGGRQKAEVGTYTVKLGDNLSTIAKTNNLSLQQLIRYNPDIKNPDIIKVGQQIKLGLDSPIENKTIHNLKEVRQQEANFDNIAAIQSSKHNSNYAILDKNKQRMFIYDSNNNLLDSIPTITGASNKDYNTKTYIDANGNLVDMKGNNSTPAGITEISSVGNYHNVPSFQRSRIGSDNKVRKGDDIASAIHFEYGVGQGSNRSNGCVRVSTEGAKILGRYIGVGDRIYTLPQDNESRFISRDGNLSFIADNVYGKGKGVKGNTTIVNGEIKDKHDWDDYNTTINKTYQPLYIDTKETGNKRYDFNKRTFADSLERNKKHIQKELGLSSSEYNTLAMVAMGIADQETKYGTAKSYIAKQILDSIGLTDKLKKIEGNNTSKSLGVGQIKYGDDSKEIKEIYDKIGITNNHNDISNEAKAIIGRLYHIYRNQYQGGKEHYKNVGLSEEEALAYLYNGGNFGYIKSLSENNQLLENQTGYGYKNLLHRILRNKTKTNKANYAKSVSGKSNNNEYYGYYKYGGDIDFNLNYKYGGRKIAKDGTKEENKYVISSNNKYNLDFLKNDKNYIKVPLKGEKTNKELKEEYKNLKEEYRNTDFDNYEKIIDLQSKIEDVGQKIGESTLKDNKFILHDTNWSRSDEKSKKYLIESHIRENNEEAKDVLNFYKSYINSKGLDRILKNQKKYFKENKKEFNKEHNILFSSPGTNDTKYYLKKRSNVPIKVFDLTGSEAASFYKPFNGRAYVYRNYGEYTNNNDDNPYLEVLAHEIGHHFNTINYGQEIGLDINKGYKTNKHDEEYIERQADVWAMKYLLNYHNIYDSRTNKDVTSEQIKKLREIYPNIRIFKQMDSDEDIAKMLNLVADSGNKKEKTQYDTNYAKYGGIHIKPSKGGTFTAAANKHGMSVQGFASKVLANKDKYSSAMVKKANFARNASKWKHKEFGGDMDFNYYITKDNIYKLGGRKKALNGTDYLKLLWSEDSNIPTVKFSGLNVNIPTIDTLSYRTRNNRATNRVSVPNPTKEQVEQLLMDDIGLGISNRSQSIVNDTLKSSSRLSKPSLQNTIDRMDAVRTIASNQPTVKTNNPGLVAQNLANGIQAGINIAGNIGSYLINRDAIRRMRGPAAPLPLRAETLPTRVSTAAQEAALRENVAKQENLLAGNLSSSRSRLNATNQIRNQGIGLYNQLQDRKGEIERELITRDKLNRQGITNQNIAQVNQWRNAARDFENKRIDLSSENAIQHLIQGPADAIAGERGFFDNLASNDRYRMTAFLEAIKNPDALRAMNSDEIKQLARRFGVRTSWLRSIGINI